MRAAISGCVGSHAPKRARHLSVAQTRDAEHPGALENKMDKPMTGKA